MRPNIWLTIVGMLIENLRQSVKASVGVKMVGVNPKKSYLYVVERTRMLEIPQKYD